MSIVRWEEEGRSFKWKTIQERERVDIRETGGGERERESPLAIDTKETLQI